MPGEVVNIPGGGGIVGREGMGWGSGGRGMGGGEGGEVHGGRINFKESQKAERSHINPN